MHTPPPPSDPNPTASHPAGDAPPPTSSLVQLLGSSLLRRQAAGADDQPTVIKKDRSPPPAPAVQGQQLGHFELIESVGAGGMATVLKARDLELGRIVALKILPPDSARDPETVSRFKQEARAAAKLDHDNIARVYFCGEDQGLHFIAFEFVEGENLRQKIDRDGVLSAADAVRFMLQLSAGLAHAAERGVVHRDVKPSNILVTPDGKAKLVDMGLARHLESHSVNGGVTQSGVTLGTFDYISPEQALDPRRADVRSDIYSLGCAFYHALTGRPPVPEGTAAKKLQAHQHEAPVDPRAYNPAIPDALAGVLATMMAKNPDHRYQTPADLSRALAGVAAGLGLSSDGVPALGSTPSAVAPPPARSGTGWLLAGGLAVAAAAVVVVMANNRGPAPTAPWGEPNPGRVAGAVPALKGDANEGGSAAAPRPPLAGPVADEKALAAALKAGEPTVHLRRGHVYDLTTLPDGAAFSGPGDLTLAPDPDPAAGAAPPVLRVAAAPLLPNERAGALTVRGAGTVRVSGVTFEVAPRDEDAAPADAEAAGVWVADTGAAEFTYCRVRLAPGAEGARLGGLAVTAGAKPTALRLTHALLDPGPLAVGLRLAGPVKAVVEQTAFGPQESAVALHPGPAAGELTFKECSFLLAPGSAAVEADPGAGCAVTAGYCVFAADRPAAGAAGMPGMTTPDAGPAVLRLDADATAAGVTFAGRTGEPNAYYRVAAFRTTARGYSFEECKSLSPVPAADPLAVLADRPPWAAADPRAKLADPDKPELAFALDLTDARLRAGPAPTHLLGVKEPTGRGRLYADTAFPPPKPRLAVAAEPGQRVFFPAAEPNDARERVYDDFLLAYRALRPGEVLLVAANGKVPVPPLPEKAGLSATIRPYPGYAPELVPGEKSQLRDAGLFKLTGGELTLEHLTLSPGPRGAVAVVSGGRGVTLRNCLVTLAEVDRDDPHAAVVVADPAREMKMAPAEVPPAPQVRFENTLVRGKGRAVWVQAARPFDLAAENTQFALDGSLLDLDPAGKELPATAPPATVHLSRVTAVLGGPVLDLRGPKDPAARVLPVAVDADRCLFAPLAADRAGPLVLVTDADPTDVTKYLTWRTRTPGVYANAARLPAALELRPPADDATPPALWGLERWREFARDDAPAVRVRFAGGAFRSGVERVVPADLRPDAAAADTGADPVGVGPAGR